MYTCINEKLNCDISRAEESLFLKQDRVTLADYHSLGLFHRD